METQAQASSRELAGDREGGGTEPEPRTGRLAAFVLLLAVTALAGAVRFHDLSFPRTYVFDETYYAKDACLDAGYPYRACRLDSPTEQTVTVHPPLGREILAAGVAAFGNRPLGWRVASAVLGTLTVLLTGALAFVLLGSAAWAAVAALLLATESLHVVQSRMSMLDAPLAFFVVAGFVALALDRQWILRRTPRTEGEGDDRQVVRPPSPLLRPWRLAAGVLLGAGVATKWSGALALAAALLLALGWERRRRADAGVRHPLAWAVREEGFGLFVLLVLVPLAVYLATYARWFAEHGLDLAEWFRLQVGMASYSIELRASHPYASRPWGWLVMTRPVAYWYRADAAAGTAAEILAIGNPAVFWGNLLVLPYLALAWLRRRDWRPGLVVVAFAVQYVPWFFAVRPMFLFYMTPLTPFMALGAALALRDLAGARLGRHRPLSLAPMAWTLVLVAVALFAFFFPVLTAMELPIDDWRSRMWFPGWI